MLGNSHPRLIHDYFTWKEAKPSFSKGSQGFRATGNVSLSVSINFVGYGRFMTMHLSSISALLFI